DPTVELWSFHDSFRRQLVRTDHGSVTAVRFFDDESFLTAGREGSVHLWSADAVQHREIARVPEAIEFALVQPHTPNFLLEGASKTLWRYDGSRTAVLASPADNVTRYVFSKDGAWLAVATQQRSVKLYDTTTWTVRGQMQLPDAIQNFDFSASGDQMAAI